ncbi:MAG TPA: YhbY family RNA-binding protein [Salinisphaeraceae bacterium]|nr:YhbY family RNA-binding protein [Salinisphaeraceae bacterium]
MQLPLPAAERRILKKQAHHLKPIVQTGAAGLTDAVAAEVDRALFDHELVKIKFSTDTRAERRAQITTLCAELEAACVQQIGHTATLYRPRPEEE